MQDVFYLSTDSISIEILNQSFRDAGFDCGYSTMVSDIGAGMIARKDGSKIELQMIRDQKKWLPLEAKPQAAFDALKPSSVAIVSYNTGHESLLRNFLKVLLGNFGGYIGCDDDWEKLYTLDEIDDFECVYNDDC